MKIGSLFSVSKESSSSLVRVTCLLGVYKGYSLDVLFPELYGKCCRLTLEILFTRLRIEPFGAIVLN